MKKQNHKIYFAASIRGGRQDVDIYSEIIGYIKKYGEVLTEHVGNKKLSQKGEQELADKDIYERDMGYIKKCDIVIAEVSNPSLGVGYEICAASEKGKEVLCLYRIQQGKKLSAMIAGCPKVRVSHYNNLGEAKKSIDDFFNSIKA